MNLGEAAVLGLVQGVTEYLPVSSSGHLVLIPWLLGWQKAPFAFDVLVQLGTLLGVLVYFRSDLFAMSLAMWRGLRTRRPFAEPEARLGWLVGLATLPAGVLGILLEDVVEAAFTSARATAAFLCVTAALIASAEALSRRRARRGDVAPTHALWIGFSQALALFPGISRSGATISGGVMLGLDRATAARFSFLMSIPVMVGAGVLTGRKLAADPALLVELGPAIAVGFGTAALSGYVVIRWFLGFVKTRSLYWFAAYCALVGVLGVAFVEEPAGDDVAPAASASP